MVRKRGKKAGASGGGGGDGGGGGGGGNTERNANPGSRTYLKVFATFKCSSDKCNKVWNSAHAWEREEAVECEFCFAKAEAVNCVDEMLDLDSYNCRCGNNWQSIHDPTEEHAQQECDNCGDTVVSNVVQKRFGRHFWFACSNEKCPEAAAWEDFSITPQRTQRCTKCKCRGDIVKLQKLRQLPPWVWKRRQELLGEKGNDRVDPGGGGGKGKHNAEHCDMCMDVVGQRIGRTCMAYRKVVCQLNPLVDGSFGENIVSAE